MALQWLKRAYGQLRPPRQAELRAGFFARYPPGASLLVHAGLPDGWLAKLVHEPGGGGHFRIDTRQPAYRASPPPRRPMPVHWLVRAHVLRLGLPLPLLVRVVEGEGLLVRHLRRHGGTCDAAEVGPLYEDMGKRPHFRLIPDHGGGFHAEAVLDMADNAMDTPYGLI